MNLTAQPAFDLIPPQAARNPMRVTKRSGLPEPIDVNKIVRGRDPLLRRHSGRGPDAHSLEDHRRPL